MGRYGYTGSNQFRPLTAWAYIRYAILFSIPVLGFLLLIIFTFNRGNINRRSFARSYWCWLLVILIITAVIAFTGLSVLGLNTTSIDGVLNKVRGHITDAVQIIFPGSDEKIEQNNPETENRITSNPNTGVEFLLDSASTADEMKPENTAKVVNSNVSSSISGVSAEFKNAMDSYEVFFDKYIAFIKRFKTSNNTAGMLGDYADYMIQYADMMQKMEDIDEKELSAAEDAYYLQVTMRIYKKLMEAIQEE